MGRPRKDDRDSILSERLGGIVVSKWERVGIDARVEQLSQEAARFGGRVSVAGYIRSLIVADLQAHGCYPAGAGTAAEIAPETPQEPSLFDRAMASVKALHPSASAPALPASPPSPAEAPPAVETPVEPTLPSSAEETPTKPRQPTPASVRKLLERAYEKHLSRNDLAELSGVPVAKLSHFRNPESDRGKLSPERLSALDAALRRWLDKHGGER